MKNKSQKVYLLNFVLKRLVPIIESVFELVVEVAWKRVEIAKEESQLENTPESSQEEE